MTRGQMAELLTRALNLPPATHDYFNDDNDSPFQDEINRLAKAGIVQACTTNRYSYCADDDITRGEMAAFLYRARNLL